MPLYFDLRIHAMTTPILLSPLQALRQLKPKQLEISSDVWLD